MLCCIVRVCKLVVTTLIAGDPIFFFFLVCKYSKHLKYSHLKHIHTCVILFRRDFYNDFDDETTKRSAIGGGSSSSSRSGLYVGVCVCVCVTVCNICIGLCVCVSFKDKRRIKSSQLVAVFHFYVFFSLLHFQRFAFFLFSIARGQIATFLSLINCTHLYVGA